MLKKPYVDNRRARQRTARICAAQHQHDRGKDSGSQNARLSTNHPAQLPECAKLVTTYPRAGGGGGGGPREIAPVPPALTARRAPLSSKRVAKRVTKAAPLLHPLDIENARDNNRDENM